MLNNLTPGALLLLGQAGLDAGYDAYAFGREGDYTKGGVAATGGLIGSGIGSGTAGLLTAMGHVPPKYLMAGALLGNFAGSVAGAELGIRTLEALRNRRRVAPQYQVIEAQPLESIELQNAPVATQDAIVYG